MEQGDAVIALDGDQFAGFCYIETWDHASLLLTLGSLYMKTTGTRDWPKKSNKRSLTTLEKNIQQPKYLALRRAWP